MNRADTGAYMSSAVVAARMDGETVFDADRPLRVAALFSGGASGVRHLLDVATDADWRVVGAVASHPDADGVTALRDRGVDVTVRDVRAFYADRDADTDDMDLRREFDRGTRNHLRSLDPEPDVVVLSGYLWILTAPVTETVPVLNVHPGDLTVEEDGERAYTGLDPVRAAVTAGDRATRSTVHFVTPTVDAGPVLVRSRPLPVHRPLVEWAAGSERGADTLDDYIAAHQEWMKWAGDGPALATALDLVAAGRVSLDDGDGGDRALVDGRPGFYDLGDDAVLRR